VLTLWWLCSGSNWLLLKLSNGWMVCLPESIWCVLAQFQWMMETSGEVVPRRSRTQKIEYDFSWRSCTRVRLFQEKSYSSILGYGFSWRICTHQILVTTSPGEKLCRFSKKILGTTSPEKKFCHFQTQNLGYEFSYWKTLSSCTSNKVLTLGYDFSVKSKAN
jgi:hypothetical protein